MNIQRMALLFLFLLLWSSPLHAGDFIDTRITFAVSDDNLLAGPGESNPSSPSTSFIPGSRSNLFFDNYNKRDSGFESLSHLVLYKKMPSFFKGLTTAAALVVRMDYWLERKSYRLRDSGSYINLHYSFNDSEKIDRSLSLIAFPLYSDRIRMGYSYRISWGGRKSFPKRSVKSPVPGGKLQFNYAFSSEAKLSLFVGVKTAILQQLITETQVESETAYGLLGGAGLRIKNFQIELGAAQFEKGTFSNPAVKGQPVNFYGFTGQVSYTYGMPIGVSIDFRLYKNDPKMAARFFKREKYTPGKLSFVVSSEASYVNNLLEDPENIGGITNSPGMATDLNFRMKYGYLRMHMDAMYRDLGFILKNVPGFVPFQAFSPQHVISPEFMAALGVDYHLPKAYLTIGLKGGIQIPATFKGKLPKELTGSIVPKSLRGEQTVLVRDEGDFLLVPPKDSNGNDVEILPIVSFKLNFKWQLSDFMAMIGELLFTIDQNETTLKKDQLNGTIIYSREFIDPFRFGFNLMLQARF